MVSVVLMVDESYSVRLVLIILPPERLSRTCECSDLVSRSVYAAMLNGAIFGIFLRFACANSYDDCISNQKLGCVPSAADRRSDISAEMPARQLRILESVTRET